MNSDILAQMKNKLLKRKEQAELSLPSPVVEAQLQEKKV